MIREKQMSAVSGWLALAILLPLLIVIVGLIVVEARSGTPAPWLIVALALAAAVDGACLGGLFVVNPNEAQVLQLFGSYAGTVKDPGLRWANPFYTKKRISQRIRNFESQRLKVNDIEGNPIEIAAVVVWKVVETAEASFEVDNYENFVHVQSESALRGLATRYPYDSHAGDHEISLRGSTLEVAEQLQREIHDRLAQAGVDVLEARISHLAYAPEIAQAMLQRQQASAIIAARQKIVDGAVGMVEMALARLSAQKIVELDEERKAAMVSNLLVVLCSERAATPVVNAGTLYTS